MERKKKKKKKNVITKEGSVDDRLGIVLHIVHINQGKVNDKNSIPPKIHVCTLHRFHPILHRGRSYPHPPVYKLRFT